MTPRQFDNRALAALRTLVARSQRAQNHRDEPYPCSMNRSIVRRTSGITKYIVGAAIAQEIIQDAIQVVSILLSQPSTR